jgi:hypothetical protein
MHDRTRADEAQATCGQQLLSNASAAAAAAASHPQVCQHSSQVVGALRVRTTQHLLHLPQCRQERNTQITCEHGENNTPALSEQPAPPQPAAVSECSQKQQQTPCISDKESEYTATDKSYDDRIVVPSTSSTCGSAARKNKTSLSSRDKVDLCQQQTR